MNTVKKGLLALAVSSSLAFAVLAHANGGTFVPTELWCGTYFGGYFGGGHGNVDQDFTASDRYTSTYTEVNYTSTNITNTTASGHLSGDATGSLTTPFIGYNFHPQSPRWNRLVLGAQFEGTLFNDVTFNTTGTLNSTSTSSNISNGIVTGSSNSLSSTGINLKDDLSSMLSIVGRVGVLVRPTWLAYGLAGFAEGHFVLPCCDDQSFLQNNLILASQNGLGATPPAIANGSATGSRNRWEPGYILGAGVEWRYNEHWSIRGEYRFNHFSFTRDNSNSSNSSSANTNSTSTNAYSNTFASSTHTDVDFNSGQVGVVYRFS